jgi:hypothetical protein
MSDVLGAIERGRAAGEEVAIMAVTFRRDDQEYWEIYGNTIKEALQDHGAYLARLVRNDDTGDRLIIILWGADVVPDLVKTAMAEPADVG